MLAREIEKEKLSALAESVFPIAIAVVWDIQHFIKLDFSYLRRVIYATRNLGKRYLTICNITSTT